MIATRGTRLYIYDTEGGTGEELVRPDAGAAHRRRDAAAVAGPTRCDKWAPRSAAIRATSGSRSGAASFMYNTPLQDYSLAVYDRESGQTTVRESRWGSAFRPVLSPDGKWLVYGTRYVNETRLRIRDLKTGDEQWLVYPVQRDDQESAASLDVLPGMAFTPDSKWLVTTWDGKLWKVSVPDGKPVEIPFEADVVQPMGPAVRFEYAIPDSATFTVKQIRDAVPSPDGRKLAFVSLDRLYVMDYPNGTPRRVSNMTRRRVRAVVESRRTVDRVLDVERAGRRPHLQGARRRIGPAAEADDELRVLAASDDTISAPTFRKCLLGSAVGFLERFSWGLPTPHSAFEAGAVYTRGCGLLPSARFSR